MNPYQVALLEALDKGNEWIAKREYIHLYFPLQPHLPIWWHFQLRCEQQGLPPPHLGDPFSYDALIAFCTIHKVIWLELEESLMFTRLPNDLDQREFPSDPWEGETDNVLGSVVANSSRSHSPPGCGC